MLSGGFIQIYSCGARDDSDANNIAAALADHFGVPVYASAKGVSIWPPFPLQWISPMFIKKRMWSNPAHWWENSSRSKGFGWVRPSHKKRITK